ncbi:MAG: alginate export family protein [Gemmatimonadales bacterium]|jgi:hypothetical protein|nr:MAG: alginate export family protein [Gemmatimonadales bacterium]
MWTISRRVILAVAAALLTPAWSLAQDITLSGQVRPRTEYRDPSSATGERQAWTTLRTRIAATWQSTGPVQAFIQLQDVRFFGEEASTLGDYQADNFDLHQGWLEVGAPTSLAALRVGRQEAVYGGQRLIGAVNWTQQGRSFDGARLRLRPNDAFQVDLLGFQLWESASPARDVDATLWGAYGVWTPADDRTLDLFTLRQETALDAGDTDQWTAGLRYVARDGGFDYRLEGAWQTGERTGQDVSAFLLGARAGRSFADGRAGLTLWFDYLSGTEPGSDEVGAFETLFATNHKFYGYADLFLDIPTHTAGRGLVDLAVKGRLQITDDWGVNLDVHRFSVAEDGGLSSGDLGTEIDLTLTRALFHGLRVSGGAAFVLAGDALGPVRGIDDDVTFAYVMLDLVF